MSFRISESADVLEVVDVPHALRALGWVFVCSGAIVLSIPLVSAAWGDFTLLQRAATLAIGAAHFAGGAYTVWQQLETRMRIDRRTLDGVHEVRRVFARVVKVTRFRAVDARRLELVQSRDTDGDPTFTLRLWLADSVALPLQGQPSYGRDGAEGRLRTLSRMLGIPTVPSTT